MTKVRTSVMPGNHGYPDLPVFLAENLKRAIRFLTGIRCGRTTANRMARFRWTPALRRTSEQRVCANSLPNGPAV